MYDALRKKKEFKVKQKKDTHNEEICRVAKANSIMIDEYEEKNPSWTHDHD